MHRRIGRLEAALYEGPRPYEHLTDAQVRAALERAARGEPLGVPPFPGPPDTWPRTGSLRPTNEELEALTDDELLAELARLAPLSRWTAPRGG